ESRSRPRRGLGGAPERRRRRVDRRGKARPAPTLDPRSRGRDLLPARRGQRGRHGAGGGDTGCARVRARRRGHGRPRHHTRKRAVMKDDKLRQAGRRRLPVVLATTALVFAVFGSTPVGHAVTTAVSPFATHAKKADFATNAGAVNGIKASKTPRAGFLVPLGKNGMFPASVAGGLTGPKGEKGDKGDQGPQGPVGPKVVAGPPRPNAAPAPPLPTPPP